MLWSFVSPCWFKETTTSAWTAQRFHILWCLSIDISPGCDWIVNLHCCKKKKKNHCSNKNLSKPIKPIKPIKRLYALIYTLSQGTYRKLYYLSFDASSIIQVRKFHKVDSVRLDAVFLEEVTWWMENTASRWKESTVWYITYGLVIEALWWLGWLQSTHDPKLEEQKKWTDGWILIEEYRTS